MDKKEDMSLKIRRIIGFDGASPKSLRLHPDHQHVVYPFGIKLAAQHLETKQQFYFEGHSNVISAVAVSRSGKYLASGQVNFSGFQAPVIVWDWERRQPVLQHDSHKGRVESVAFSACEQFVISLGGRDDANLIVYNILTKDPICGVFSSNRNAGDAVVVGPLHGRGVCFVTGGVMTLKVWTLLPKTRSVTGQDVQMGKIKRKFTCIEVDIEDNYAYCGTSTGDIAKIKLNFSADPDNCEPVNPPALIGCFGKYEKKKKDGSRSRKPVLYSMGVRQLIVLGKGRLLVGAGDGTLELVEELQPPPVFPMECKPVLSSPTQPLYVALKSVSVGGLVTSLQLRKVKNGCQILVGTRKSEIIVVDLDTFAATILLTCHTSAIFDVSFPRNYSDVFATASKDDIRLWSVAQGKELLRIAVPNFTCSGIAFTEDGAAVLTGWNDGTIKAFTPQSGKLIFCIKDGHSKGVSALAVTKKANTLISGGNEGQLRIWKLTRSQQTLMSVLKEHKGPISSIDVAPDDTTAVSASTDGTCNIWDLASSCRLGVLFRSTLFTCVRYHPGGASLLTCGTNRQIGYWGVYSGTLIREVEGSTTAALNALHISPDGQFFVTGANDHLVKVWKFFEGKLCYLGTGHGAVVTAVTVSPDMKTIITCSADGAILMWHSPFRPERKSSTVRGGTPVPKSGGGDGDKKSTSKQDPAA